MPWIGSARISVVLEPDAVPVRRWRYVLDTLDLLVVLLLNVSVGTAVAWLVAFCFSEGLVLSGQTAENQSNATFLTGTLLWVQVFFCSMVLVTRATSLMRLEFNCRPGRSAARSSSSLPPLWRRARLEMYLITVIDYLFFAAVDSSARRIYRHETRQGQQTASIKSAGSPRLGQTQPVRAALPFRTCVSSVRRVLLHSASAFVATIVPLVAVHSIQLAGPIHQGNTLLWLTLGSTAFKILVQEVARRHVLRRRIVNPRNMALVVCIPTVLIDTQVRVLLIGPQDTRTGLYGSLLLAVLELCVRVAKLALVQRKLRQRTADAMTATWTQQVLRHHAVEVAADMYAEYLAIGCSSAILFFFSSHAKFRLPGATASASIVSTLKTWGGQVAIELLVDVVSCLAEHLSGLSFAPIQQERRFFMFLFAAIAVVNVCFSAMLHTNG
ncbi:hypothetical protein P43SY_008148 [Pythium insidiosum]|uniref:Transmembrane protein n=1 Tax=Pythium insidiosum TaxID=114742 RepID=A0AAD5LIM7_PYTIN|nr:hypothetical protein P43SY_008148 [Pythium insidiosum]